MKPMTAEEFSARIDVSRETLARLQDYLGLIESWQQAVNLVGPATLKDPWRRHILDSAQLMCHLPETDCTIYDLGSGAGLPGLVLAILGRTNVHLVESDQRKALFLKEVVRKLDLKVDIHMHRIETLPDECADVITARALAPLPRLLELAEPLSRTNTTLLFLKGRSALDELTEARKSWRMSADVIPSLSEPEASVLKLWDITRAPLHR